MQPSWLESLIFGAKKKSCRFDQGSWKQIHFLGKKKKMLLQDVFFIILCLFFRLPSAYTGMKVKVDFLKPFKNNNKKKAGVFQPTKFWKGYEIQDFLILVSNNISEASKFFIPSLFHTCLKVALKRYVSYGLVQVMLLHRCTSE